MNRSWRRHLFRTLGFVLGVVFGFGAIGVRSDVVRVDSAASAGSAYFGIAGFGGGMGLLGHAFVLFAPQRGQMLGAYAYQYNLQLKSEPRGLLEIRKALKTSHFIETREDVSLAFIQKYTGENRVVLLYELNLSPEEIRLFDRELQADRQERELHPRADYDIRENNCLTVPLEKLNAIVTPERRFRIDHSIFSLLDLTHNVPLVFATELERHPLFKPKPMVFNPAVFKVLRTQVALDQDLEKLGSLCRWSQAESASVRQLARNLELLKRPAFGDFLATKQSACADAKASADLLDEIQALRSSLIGE